MQARLPLLSTYLGHADPKSTYWYLSAAPELLALAAERLEHAPETRHERDRPRAQEFFTERLIAQRQASPHTVAAYRDTLHGCSSPCGPDQREAACRARLRRPRRRADQRRSSHHLENERGNSVTTRNARLAAVRSLFRYAALPPPSTPPSSHGCWRSRPSDRDRAARLLPHPDETDALLSRPAPGAGRTPRPGPAPLAVQTGLRVSELTAVRNADVAPRPRRARPLPRQGPQGTGRPADQPHRRGPAPMAQPNERRPRGPVLPRPWRAASAATQSSARRQARALGRSWHCPSLAAKKIGAAHPRPQLPWPCCTPASTPRPHRTVARPFFRSPGAVSGCIFLTSCSQ